MINQKFDIYTMVTEKIIDGLNAGTIPWRRTWKGGAAPMNYKTKKPYKGVNRLLLSLTPYEQPYFLTYKQALEVGGQIKKGAKSLPIVFWKWVYKDDNGKSCDPAVAATKFAYGRYYRVFNIQDTEGIPFPVNGSNTQNTPIQECENIWNNWTKKPDINHGGNEAYYSPRQDVIQIPNFQDFDSAETYYSTLFHEAVHATGHSTRLNRDGVTNLAKFGDHSYSKEELVAEIGAAFLCYQTGIEQNVLQNQTAYIQHWLKKLQDDHKLIYSAAKQAEEAAKCISHSGSLLR